MNDRYSPKDPTATPVVSMNFISEIGAETIITCVVDITRADGAAADTTSMVIGSADLSDSPIMKQKIGGGVHGTDYLVRFKATTATRIIVLSATMLVKNGG
jgi:hypothetical protein